MVHTRESSWYPLSGPIVMAKALSFASQINGEGNTFKGSQGCLNKFQELLWDQAVGCCWGKAFS